MSEQQVKMKLKQRPDGFGFLYGQLHKGDEIYNVNILPPVDHWDGNLQLAGYEPHKSDWVLYVDGEEIARVRNQTEIKGKFIAKLLI